MNLRLIQFMIVLAVLMIAGNSPASDLTVKDYVNALKPQKYSDSTDYNLSVSGARTQVIQEPSIPLQLQFKKDSVELTSSSVQKLQTLGKALLQEELKDYIYLIEGHTCDIGSEEYNIELSKQRAFSVRNFLMDEFSFPEQQLISKGMGKQYPLVPNTDEQSREINRRVVFRNTLQKHGIDISVLPQMSVKLKYVRDNQVHILENGDMLTHKDNYAIELKLKNMAYVYVYQVDEKGNMDEIFPSDYLKKNNPLNAGYHRIPEQKDRWLYLDKTDGTEHVVVLANREPLVTPEKICMNQLNPSGEDSAKITISPEDYLMGVQGDRKQKVSYSSQPALFVWKRYFIHE